MGAFKDLTAALLLALVLATSNLLADAECTEGSYCWCVISTAEYNKCVAMNEAFKDQVNLGDMLSCYQMASHQDCIVAIQGGEAQLVTLDGGDIYTAGKDYGLVPILGEDYGVGDGSASYWAVAAVRADDTEITIQNLQGRNSCHTGIGKTAGWNMPVGYLIEEGYIEVDSSEDDCDVPAAVGEFFEASCAPGALSDAYDPEGTNPANLCQLCIGEGDDFCARSHNEPYYDYSGAFRCLAEGAGEVAFIKHTTVPENTDGNSTEAWAVNLLSENYRLLCRDGSRAAVTQYLDCNLEKVPSHALMTSGEMTSEWIEAVQQLLLDAQENFGSDEGDGFKMFDSADFGGSDLLFKDSTAQLVDVGDQDTYEEWLGEDYIQAIQAVTCDLETEGATAIAPPPALAILSLLTLALFRLLHI